MFTEGTISTVTNDFFDTMAPTWSAQMAKQYNKDMKQDDINKTIDKVVKNIKDQINPVHYQGIVGPYQYIECMEFILGQEGLKAHLKGQIYKYMMRLGKKDADLQEIQKVVWYSRCLEILLREGTIVGKLSELK